MNPFKKKCIDYLINSGWEQDCDGWEWYYNDGLGREFRADTLGEALDQQMEYDDEDSNPVVE